MKQFPHWTLTTILPCRHSFPVASSVRFSPSSPSFLQGCVGALKMTRLHRVSAGRCGRDWRRSLDGVATASRFYVRKEWKTSKMKRCDGGGGGNAVGGGGECRLLCTAWRRSPQGRTSAAESTARRRECLWWRDGRLKSEGSCVLTI